MRTNESHRNQEAEKYWCFGTKETSNKDKISVPSERKSQNSIACIENNSFEIH